MKRWFVMLPVALGVVLMIMTLMDQPSPTAAGGLPCFLCHGFQFQGSDLAPSVADTKLTDEEILKQIRDPRGVMPAFPEFASQSIVDRIREMPTGQPTAVLSDGERSAALAMIAGVAASRATEFAAMKPSEADSTPPPPTSTPIVVSTLPAGAGFVSSDTTAGTGTLTAVPAVVNMILVIVGLLIVGGSAWWAWQRRKAV